MEHYYFLQKNGTSQGPYKLDVLKAQDIQANDLVWRDNLDDWVKASDLDELTDLFINKSLQPESKENSNDNKMYYFIQQDGIKKGPFKLSELKELTIFFDELVWRSDNDKWRKAEEFEELNEIFIIKPPLTPKEKKIVEINQNFTSKIIGQLAITYFITSLLIGFISYSIAQSSWERYLKNTEGKYLGNNRSSNSSGMISYSELNANKRYPYYLPNSNNESAYGNGQGFWFRPFKAFGSTIYLTISEQKKSSLLLGNLLLSSFASLSFIFVIFGIIYYAIKRADFEEKPEIKKNLT